ncbi:TRAP transporter large permease [Paradesulfitobacterium ferrireducens]|uniref:TRAP transporter large permease n=1 Tax=Paradesulfitobacterium ferrireducens TaxID=2816476 RepID=UPI002E28E85D|nr:TRAP transporter large permease [Paradesulfitobacterium ferrireducens]
MDPSIIALIGIVVMLLLMFLKMPISFTMFVVGFTGVLIFASPGAAFNLLQAELWNQFSSYSLSIIPLYILMGEIIFRSGITEKLFVAAYKWFGHLRGGMAGTTVLASSGFAAICGSNSATAATMSTIALPELKKYKYDQALSTGSVAAGGTLGIIIPPSTVLIVIAIQTQQSVRQLFAATIIPGVMLMLLFLATISYLCMRNPELGPAGPKTPFKEKVLSLKGVIPVFLLFFFVVGGLFKGWFTPTESGAFGSLGAIILALSMRKLTWENLRLSIASTLRSSAMVILLIVAAMVFGRFLTLTRLPFAVAEWVVKLPIPPSAVLIIIFLIFVIGGSLMDALGFLIIAIPIFYPTVMALGYDPIWFAIVLNIVTSMGAITPPVGVNVFVVQGLSGGVAMSTVFRGAMYFLAPYVLLIALLIVLPQIVLFVVK